MTRPSEQSGPTLGAHYELLHGTTSEFAEILGESGVLLKQTSGSNQYQGEVYV